MLPLEIRSFSAFKNAEALWREAERSADLHVYQTYDWLTGWYQFVGAARQIEPCLVAVCEHDGQLLMLLPLAIERGGLWRRLVWMGAEFFDYHAPVLMPDATAKLRRRGADAVWKAVCDELPGVDYADFEFQPGHVGEQTNSLLGNTAMPCSLSAHHTDLIGDWSSYYVKKRSRRTRHNDRRKRKKLEQQGNLSFVIARDRDDIDRLIPAMIRQKQAYVETLGDSSILDWPGYDELLRHLAHEGLKDGSILLCGLSLDGKILAVQWGAVHRHRLYSVLASYDSGEYGRFSPGDVLLRDLMSWCFDQGIEVFDFTRGDEPYKGAWCEHQFPLYRSLIPVTLWGGLRSYPLLWHMKLRRWVKGRERLALFYGRTRKLIYGT